jgi:hypothetical protein
MRFSSILPALALALAGCTSAPPVPESHLTGLIELPAETGQGFRLPKTLRYTAPATGYAAGSKDKQFYLVAGTYRPYKYNQSGTFYIGEQPAIVERKLASTGAAGTILRIGGIWIPADPAAAPKLFIVPDYYKQLADSAPIPVEMRAANLAEFRHQSRTNPNGDPAMVMPMPVVAAIKTLTPLQAGLAAGALTGVFLLLNEPGASHELAFATGDIADPDSVRQIRTAFASTRKYSGT